MRLPLPTTVITGALGVGKTTAIAALLKRKPEGEKWAVLVNEFGALGIDGALLESAACSPADAADGQSPLEGVVVKQLAGGCMCCVSAGMLAPAVAMLIRQAKPDRLLIEPSGLGHPAGMLDILQGEHLKSAIQIQAVICLVAPANAQNLDGLHLDQVNLADVVVATKADLAAAEDLDSFMEWGNSLYPPKAAIESVTRGELNMVLLDIPRTAVPPPKFEELHQPRDPHSHGHDHNHDHDHGHNHGPGHSHADTNTELLQLVPGKPLRFEASTGGDQAAGWVFSPEDTFQEESLLELLQLLWVRVKRIKGIFRTGSRKWVVPTLATVGNGPPDYGANKFLVQFTEVAYRRDSRLEIIVNVGEAHGVSRGSSTAPDEVQSSTNRAETPVAAALNGSWDEFETFLKSVLK